MTASKQDTQQIAALIEQYRRGFANLDPEVLKAIWDHDYDNLIYVAQEATETIRGWAAIRRYYNSAVGGSGHVKTMTVSDLSVDVFDNVAFAYCTFDFEGEFDGQTFAAGGRITFIMHRTGEEWKVIHYHESAPGSVSMAEQGVAR